MAEWKPFDLKWGRSIWYCSACEESTEVPTYLGTPMYNFCPYCGANMNMKKADGCKTENSSEKPNNCEYAKNPSGDVWECGCFLDTYCEHQIYDRNPDGTINIVECGYEPKDEPTISKMEQVDDDAYFLELMGAVERGEISDAGANQAWYEHINHKDEPQTDGNDYRL